MRRTKRTRTRRKRARNNKRGGREAGGEGVTGYVYSAKLPTQHHTDRRQWILDLFPSSVLRWMFG